MNDSRLSSSTPMTIDTSTINASPVVAMDALLTRILLGALCVAAVAVLSLPQARTVSAAFGWTPLWLIAMPLSAWLALQARRRALRADVGALPVRHRRRAVAMSPRRRATIGPRGVARVRAACAG